MSTNPDDAYDASISDSTNRSRVRRAVPGRLHPEVWIDEFVRIPTKKVAAYYPRQAAELWPLVQALERACWKRKWSEVKAARKALEARIGDRPHDPLFAEHSSNDEGGR